MKLFAGAVALVLALAPAGAAPADPPAPPPGTVKAEGGLRHEATGIVFPDELEGMRPIVTGTDLIMAMYMPSNPMEMLKGKVAILGVSKIAEDPGHATMAERARESFHETGVPKVVSEGRFDWPGHPKATTFHGVYEVGPYHKEYWRGWDGGWDATMIVTSPRGDRKLAGRVSAAVAAKVYGGAVVKD
jgi:hypothetical protein